MTKPVYTSAAQQDLSDILAYIARDKPRAAVEWIKKSRVSVCLLQSNLPWVNSSDNWEQAFGQMLLGGT